MNKKQTKVVLALVVGLGATLTVLLGVLGAAEVDGNSCVSGDDRATCVDGNIALGSASCALFSTPNGETIFWIGNESSSGANDDYVTATSFGTYLNLSVTASRVILGSVIKAGTNYNVYYGAVLSGLNAPVNDGGQEPEISHWTVCYYFPDITTSTGQVTTSTAPETTTSEIVTSTVPEQTTTSLAQTTTTASTSTSLVVDNTTTTQATTTTGVETTTSTSTPKATSTTTEVTTTTEPETSTSEVSDTTVTAPSSTTTADGETTTTDEASSETLPRTGPSSSLLMLLLGSGLVGLGYSLVATTKNSPRLTD